VDAGDMIPVDEASEQLAYVRRIAEQARLRVGNQYELFVVWGLVWIAGYLSSVRWYREGDGGLWFPLIVLGDLASVAVVVHKLRAEPRRPDGDFRPFAAIGLIIVGLLALPALLLQNVDPEITSAFYPYVFGLTWLAFGVLLGRPYLLLGAVLLGSSLVSLPMSWEAQQYFLGLVAGGGMASFGLWLGFKVRRLP
jgi:hypothetical protein